MAKTKDVDDSLSYGQGASSCKNHKSQHNNPSRKKHCKSADILLDCMPQSSIIVMQLHIKHSWSKTGTLSPRMFDQYSTY